MKYAFPLYGFLTLTFAAATAQIASHTPTVFTTPSPSDSAILTMNPVGKPVARVNGSVLTDADLVREEYSIFPYARQHNGLPKDLAPQIRDGAMKMIIFEELVYQEALRRKIVIPVAKMQTAEADFRKQFATPQEFNALLQSEFHGSTTMLREKIRRSLLIESLLKSEVDSKGTVTPAEVGAYYDKNPDRFIRPELFTFQTISVLPPAQATPNQLKEGHKRADDALKQAKATKTAEEFGLLAEKISDDDYRVMMGQHKPMTGDKLAPQVLKALLAMKAGDVSDVIPIEQAYTIVRLQEHKPAGKAKFEDEKVQLAKELQLSKTSKLRAELDKRLRQNAKIEEL
jgi:parvulin-like peptidyl-prolyl isomerase